MDTILSVKQRFGIIGDNPKLNRALEKSIKVANSDISVLVTGESGVGKENIPKIIHQYSHRNIQNILLLTVGQFQMEQLILNYLAMRKVHLQVLLLTEVDISKLQMVVQFF